MLNIIHKHVQGILERLLLIKVGLRHFPKLLWLIRVSITLWLGPGSLPGLQI